MRARHHGMAMIYTLVTTLTLLGFVSLAVDLGRVQVTKTQLRTAADAAARWGAIGLQTSQDVASSNAISAAAGHKVDNSAMVLLPADVVVGTWTAGSGFSAGGISPNAVRVKAYRTHARSTAVPLLFAQIVGFNTCDVTTTSIALYTPGNPGYGVIGLNSFKMSSNAYTDSYDATQGPYNNMAPLSNGTIATNGDITLGGNSQVTGNAYYGAGQDFNENGNSWVTGSASPLGTALSYPNASAGSVANTNNNMVIPGSMLDHSGNLSMSAHDSLTLPAGNYYLSSFTAIGHAAINVTGPVNIYVNGDIDLAGAMTLTANHSTDVQIFDVSAGSSITLSGSSAVSAEIYAPQCDVTISSNTNLYGSVIGQTIKMTGNAGAHYDQSAGSGIGTGTVSLVQ
jgi:Flp pilus assembly protein TadG